MLSCVLFKSGVEEFQHAVVYGKNGKNVERNRKRKNSADVN